MSRVAVLGAGGMLGHKVCQRLRGEAIGLVRQPEGAYRDLGGIFDEVDLVGGVDVLAGESLERALDRLQPTAIVNCVGLVKQLEEAVDPYLAVAINSLLPHRLARFCGQANARLIHISTDCVFSGRTGGYRESDPHDVDDLYGRSKSLGETLPSERRAVTLRTSFIGRELGSSTHGLIEWFLAQNRGDVNGFERVIYSGLTSLELADVIARVLAEAPEVHGVYHVASEPISKYDLLMLVREVYGLDITVRSAQEPVCDRSLSPAAFRSATGYEAPSWSAMIRSMYEDATPYDELALSREETS